MRIATPYFSLFKRKNARRILFLVGGTVASFFLLFSNVLALPALASFASQGRVFASSNTVPLLQFPEGLTNWQGKVYVGAYNVVTPTNSRIFVFNEQGKLLCQLGGQPGQQLISDGQLLGLTINRQTGDLFANANGTGNVLRIHNPGCNHPIVSIYATYPGTGGGPEDMAFNAQGTLYDSDSNRGLVYAIPPGGGMAKLVIGPPSSGAPIDDKGLLQAPIAGLTPNGVVFSLDFRTLYIANTYADSVVAFDVNSRGQVTGNARIFAQHLNPDLEEYPTGFTGLIQKNTKIGPSASTPLNGPDGLALDSKGRVWVDSNLGDNITVLDCNGKVVKTYGTSEVTAHGLLNQPASLTFVGDSVYTTNLSIFTALAGKPKLPFTVVRFDVGVTGAGGNGNY
ncbi:MAG: hypothetical protein NVSMB38_26910 [Ktedonobacteraceae bacterium]